MPATTIANAGASDAGKRAAGGGFGSFMKTARIFHRNDARTLLGNESELAALGALDLFAGPLGFGFADSPASGTGKGHGCRCRCRFGGSLVLRCRHCGAGLHPAAAHGEAHTEPQ